MHELALPKLLHNPEVYNPKAWLLGICFRINEAYNESMLTKTAAKTNATFTQSGNQSFTQRSFAIRRLHDLGGEYVPTTRLSVFRILQATKRSKRLWSDGTEDQTASAMTSATCSNVTAVESNVLDWCDQEVLCHRKLLSDKQLECRRY